MGRFPYFRARWRDLLVAGPHTQTPGYCCTGADATVCGIVPCRWGVSSDYVNLISVSQLAWRRAERMRKYRSRINALEPVAGVEALVHRFVSWLRWLGLSIRTHNLETHRPGFRT